MATDEKIKLLNKGDKEEANQGWADAMARILQKELPENKVSEYNKLIFLTPGVITFFGRIYTNKETAPVQSLKKGKTFCN